jgi:hypothetical protein
MSEELRCQREGCGRVIPRAPGTPGAKPKFCSYECRKPRKGQPAPARKCTECGGDVTGSWNKCAVCRELPPDVKLCARALCQLPIPVTRAANAKFCSQECGLKSKWENERERRAEAGEPEPMRRATLPGRTKGSRNAEAKEGEQNRTRAIRSQLDTRLWEIHSAAYKKFRSARAAAAS